MDEKRKKMKTKTEKAIESFRAGLNCSQAVLSAYSEELNFDEKLALNVSCGFGGGMGRMQGTCGAVTGAYMAIGIFNGNRYTDNAVKKAESYLMIRKFSENFKKINGSTDCLALLNCEIKTEEGHNYAKEKNLFGTVCEKCISDSLSILDELL
jgi:C_GCAxxG_C_C family probable redox protein